MAVGRAAFAVIRLCHCLILVCTALNALRRVDRVVAHPAGCARHDAREAIASESRVRHAVSGIVGSRWRRRIGRAVLAIAQLSDGLNSAILADGAGMALRGARAGFVRARDASVACTGRNRGPRDRASIAGVAPAL